MKVTGLIQTSHGTQNSILLEWLSEPQDPHFCHCWLCVYFASGLFSALLFLSLHCMLSVSPLHAVLSALCLLHSTSPLDREFPYCLLQLIQPPLPRGSREADSFAYIPSSWGAGWHTVGAYHTLTERRTRCEVSVLESPTM